MGNPTGFHLTPGNSADLEGADTLIPSVDAEHLLGDKAYDADNRVLEILAERGIEAVIPPKKNRKIQRDFDKYLYRSRHLIENLFAKLKNYRAIATRYDKLSAVFKGAIYMAAFFIWLN